MIIPYKRGKWSRLVINSGFDKYTVPIFHACAGSRKVPLLKTLMSSYCSNNCKFCAQRCERRMERKRWEPEELAKITSKLWELGKIQGLFLSSSVEKDPDSAVEKQIETLKILRNHGFLGYCHLRLMPGVNKELIKQSAELADRVGINIEFPKAKYYNDMKVFLSFKQDIIKRIKFLARQIEKVQKEGKCKAGLDTQMIVGASNETDKEILKMSEWTYNKLKARRVYFSAFEPIRHTPLENRKPENKLREYRLYQSSFLIQKYGFKVRDFALNDSDNLFLNQDPKFLMAKKQELIVDVNGARFEELIKVPGIGPETARKIVEKRNLGIEFKNQKQLKKLGVVIGRASIFIKINSNLQTKLSNFLSSPL
jgi:predicted DNA-binding helix-hairpin-helix protein